MVDKQKLEQAMEQFKKCSPVFIALGDTTRQKILMDLAEAGESGINVAQLSGKSILSRPAISHHLKVLKDSGLIEPVKKGTQIFYKLCLEHKLDSIKTLIQMVEDIMKTMNKSVSTL